MTLDEAKAAAHDSCPATECDRQGGDHNLCEKHHGAIDTLATVAYNAGKVAGWDENVKACVEAQRKAAERMRERAALVSDRWAHSVTCSEDDTACTHKIQGAACAVAIRALPLEEEKR